MIEEVIEGQHTKYWYTISELAKMLNLCDEDGKSIGRNKMFRVLRYNKVLMEDNQPYQYYVMLGHAKLHCTTRRWKNYYIPVFSDLGVNYLKNKFAGGGFIICTDWVKPERQGLSLDDVC